MIFKLIASEKSVPHYTNETAKNLSLGAAIYEGEKKKKEEKGYRQSVLSFLKVSLGTF